MNHAAAAPTGGIAPASDAIPSHRTSPTGLLLAAVLASAVGVAATTFRGDGTALNAFLFLDLGLPHGTAGRLERSAAALMLLATIVGVWRGRGAWFLPAAAYFLAEALARRHVQGQAFSEWVLLTQAARYLTPAVLVLWLFTAHRPGGDIVPWKSAGAWVLRFALAAVFVSHGLEALRANPVFVDLILSSALNLTGLHFSETGATLALEWIGIADFAVAGALILRPHPAVLLWAAGWAAVTALSRMSANGWGAYPDVLLRASYFLAPLALWQQLQSAPDPRREPPPAMRG